MPREVRLNAVHGINRYLYEKGKGLIFPVEGAYGGRTAFVPVDQITAVNKLGQPFVVYNWAMPRITEDWYMQTEQIIYLVYSTNLEEIRKISNFIIDCLKQYDRSATNIQAWLEQLPSNKWGNRDYNPYTMLELYTVSIDNLAGPTPIEEAGGLMEAMITVNVRYGLIAQVSEVEDETAPSTPVHYGY